MNLVSVTCWCGIEHAIPSALDRTARETGRTVFCPLGHQWTRKESELAQERRRRQRLQQDNARLAEERAALEQRARTAEAALGRHKRRSAAGLCPCCNRSFVNMARHMKTKHPDFSLTPRAV